MAFDQDLRAYLETLDGESPIETYALETYLVRRVGPRHVEVTPLGNAFLRLRGKDALQWLLTVEVAQSRGIEDPWLVSREALMRALGEHGLQAIAGADVPARRMVDLGVFDPDFAAYVVAPAMRPLVELAIAPGPWRNAVETLLTDERAAIIPGLRPSLADATSAQTRMIVHEVRNALVPVRIRLDALLESGETPQPQLLGARRGVVRVLAFVEQMLEISELVNEHAANLDAIALIRDAIASVDDGDHVEVRGGVGVPGSHAMTSPGRLLIIDDDLDFVDVYRQLLERQASR